MPGQRTTIVDAGGVPSTTSSIPNDTVPGSEGGPVIVSEVEF